MLDMEAEVAYGHVSYDDSGSLFIVVIDCCAANDSITNYTIGTWHRASDYN